MKMRLGGVLAIALGAVLIGNGLSSSGDGAVGGLPPASVQCGAPVLGVVSLVNNCPVGTIRITDATPAAAGVPADWDVTITSTNCLAPGGGTVTTTVTVPTGGSATSSDLFIFTNFRATVDSPRCSYTLTREVNPLFTATFTPASPVTIPATENDTQPEARTRQVTLVNQAVVAPTTSAAPTTSTAPSTSASADPTETGSVGTPVFVTNTAGPASDSQAAAPIADTGPRESITASLWLGIGLVLLGLFLLFEGRIRKLGKHHD